METKLVAAEIATGAGVSTIITSSQNPENIFKIIEYHNTADRIRSTLQRPPHTIFKPSLTPMRDVKSWTSHTLSPSGSVVIDTGAHHVLSRRESGGRLLSAGVIGVKGSFASHQAVRICIRVKPGESGHEVDDAEEARLQYVKGLAGTQPGTPTLLSRASSITDLESLSAGPDSKLGVIERDQVVVGRDTDDFESWELLEVGRGLTNYNSAQIESVKGLNRSVHFSSWVKSAQRCHCFSSHIYQMLGYADSDYVVENITIRVPP